ncbi:hypothetical protein DFQ26_001298 [Actinomortierella ambigua]|nr:hypothetical protein DFQ26_001298 [Actinomortierella ambigua]
MSNDNWKVGCIVRRDRKELMALMVKETEVALWTVSMDDWTWQFMTKAEPGQGYEGISSTQLSGMMGCAYSISVGFLAILQGKNNRLQGLLYDGPHSENSKWTVLDMDAAAGIDPSTIALWVTGDYTYMYGALRNKITVAFGVLEKGNQPECQCGLVGVV